MPDKDSGDISRILGLGFDVDTSRQNDTKELESLCSAYGEEITHETFRQRIEYLIEVLEKQVLAPFFKERPAIYAKYDFDGSEEEFKKLPPDKQKALRGELRELFGRCKDLAGEPDLELASWRPHNGTDALCVFYECKSHFRTKIGKRRLYTIRNKKTGIQVTITKLAAHYIGDHKVFPRAGGIAIFPAEFYSSFIAATSQEPAPAEAAAPGPALNSGQVKKIILKREDRLPLAFTAYNVGRMTRKTMEYLKAHPPVNEPLYVDGLAERIAGFAPVKDNKVAQRVAYSIAESICSKAGKKG